MINSWRGVAWLSGTAGAVGSWGLHRDASQLWWLGSTGDWEGHWRLPCCMVLLPQRASCSSEAMLPPIPTATPVQPCLSSSRARELMEAAESEGSEDLTAAEREQQLGIPQLEQRPSGEDGTFSEGHLSEGHLDADVESEQEGAAGSGAAARQRGIAGAAGAAAASGTAAAAAAGRGLVGHPLRSPDAHPLPSVSGHPLPPVASHPLATPTVQGHPLASPSAHPLGASPAAHPLASPPGHPLGNDIMSD